MTIRAPVGANNAYCCFQGDWDKRWLANQDDMQPGKWFFAQREISHWLCQESQQHQHRRHPLQCRLLRGRQDHHLWSFPRGSVSMIVHTHLFHKGSERVERKNFINITLKDLDFLAASDSELSLHADYKLTEPATDWRWSKAIQVYQQRLRQRRQAEAVWAWEWVQKPTWQNISHLTDSSGQGRCAPLFKASAML